MTIDGFEEAIGVFFRQPGLDYTRHMREALDDDPEYLNAHRDHITNGVKTLLRDAGISWDDTVMKGSATKLVWEAVVRLRGVEKRQRTSGGGGRPSEG
jgi:hypothetical protein